MRELVQRRTSCVSQQVHTQSAGRGQGRELELAPPTLSLELVVLEEARAPTATPDLAQRESFCSFTHA